MYLEGGVGGAELPAGLRAEGLKGNESGPSLPREGGVTLTFRLEP